VFKDGLWSSNAPLTDPPNPGGGGAWGAGSNGTGTWYGSSLGNPGTPQQSLDAAETAFGTLELIRTFDSGFPTNWNNSTGKVRLYETNPDIKVVWHSFKPGATNMKIAGGTDAGAKTTLYNKFKTYTDSIPTNVRVVMTVWHEPEQEISGGQFSRADWHAACDLFQDAVSASRAARTVNKNWLKHAPVLMGITVAGDRGDPNLWHQAGMDAYGVDAYHYGSMSSAATYYSGKGWNWGVGEFGEDFTGDGQQTRDQKILAYLKEQVRRGVLASEVKPRWFVYWQAIDGGFDILLDQTQEPLSCAYWAQRVLKGTPTSTPVARPL
jgi:hypothetical protein